MNRILTILLICYCAASSAQPALPVLKISANKRFFQTADGKPFFWMGDTGWLLFKKCDREDAVKYLDIRKQQGFNVVQAMLMHEVDTCINAYGDSALIDKDIARPLTTPGNRFSNKNEYDYWDHVEFIIDEAAKRGIYIALVPIWGSNVKGGKVSIAQAKKYAEFLAKRYRNKTNILWLNGGDIKGSDAKDVWQAIGIEIKKNDPWHLVTYHPRGRNSSSEWFHHASWLDFNMFQSGHRTYEQDTSSNENLHYGEDNWRYIVDDYKLQPVKPTMDGEPSYENIPHGLHDFQAPRWTAADVRRYAYWSVFAGGAGFTYGENAVMQFHHIGDKDANYGVNQNWKDAIQSPGANQVQYLKKLMLSKSYFDRTPAQEILADNNQQRYNYLVATKGPRYAMIYIWTGRIFKIDLSKLKFKPAKAAWFNPSNGTTQQINNTTWTGIVEFNPPGEPTNGNDWVLILE